MAIMEEKQIILKRQQEEVNRLMNTQVGGPAGRMAHQTHRGTVRANGMPRRTQIEGGRA